MASTDSSKNSKSAKSAVQDALASVDVKSIVGDITAILQDAAAEVTDPRFQTILTTLATDALKVQALKLSNADPAIIAEAEAAIKARASSIAKVPGLIVSGRQTQVIGVINKAISLVSTVAFNVLRAYVGIPAVPATP